MRNRWSTVAALLLCAAGAAYADDPVLTGLPGDVTRDGLVNVLDVQKSVNQVLGSAEATQEADLDGNDAVDVRDVQNLINSALGVGGVFQRITGVVSSDSLPAGARVLAVSTGGLRTEGAVDSEGRFELTLRTGAGWSLLLADAAGSGQGPLLFSTQGETTTTLTLPDLSIGGILDLGNIPWNFSAGEGLVSEDLLSLLGDLLAPIIASDANTNGLADFIEPLLEPILTAQEYWTLFLPEPGDGEVDPATALLNRIAECITENQNQLVRPSLSDDDFDGVPDFVLSFLSCIGLTMTEWFDGFDWSGTPLVLWLGDTDGNGLPWIVDTEIAYLTSNIPSWLDSLERLETQDDNHNGVPDFIEDRIIIPGVFESGPAPNVTGDDDQDGVPNFLDPDFLGQQSGDYDADGIPDSLDWDDDNDGTPDYADANPQDPALE